MPQCAKSASFLVATRAPHERAMAAIWQSAWLIGRPAATAWTAIPSWSWRWPSYREVRERRYLDLAAHLIGQRGRGLAGNVYPEHRGGTAVFQDDASVRARCTGTLALRSGWEYKAL